MRRNQTLTVIGRVGPADPEDHKAHAGPDQPEFAYLHPPYAPQARLVLEAFIGSLVQRLDELDSAIQRQAIHEIAALAQRIGSAASAHGLTPISRHAARLVAHAHGEADMDTLMADADKLADFCDGAWSQLFDVSDRELPPAG